MRLVESSNTKDSGPSEVPRFVDKIFFTESEAGVLVLDNRVDHANRKSKYR